ncbi:hypothetical protein [Stigmatella erecta]|uniref:Uncharacterized protein n=1 Tax=Stigmatella erecta TaxID=83460 RepID=A0A1I0AIF1_9BACT|nr:hypothetical protein [Stigmatella erecta]SES93993.1 hypothetical protein SAMN05443639_101698 [Stigmatella erecta]
MTKTHAKKTRSKKANQFISALVKDSTQGPIDICKICSFCMFCNLCRIGSK